MIFTQYHLLHNEMQKEVIHDWMNHFNPILNKYNTVKKKLKAKVTERKELNVQKDKTSILNPIQHIKLNQQLTTITEEIEELKSRKEQLIFQAECSTDKDMMQIPLHRITDSASNGSVFPVVTEHFSASSDHAFL